MKPKILLLATSILLAGCAAVPHLGTPPVPHAAAALASTHSLAGAVAEWPDRGWWQSYGDPQLVRLMDEALAGSPDVAVAAARVRSAEGALQVAGAGRLPSAKIDGTAGYTKQSYNNGFPREFLPQGWNDEGGISLSAGLDLDLWGKTRAAIRAATSEAEAARIDAEQARLMLTTNVAAAYADLAQLYADRDVAVSALSIRQDSLKLVGGRVEGGLDTQAELKQAAAAVPAAQGDIEAIDEQIALTRNRLAALVGAGPDRGVAIARPSLSSLRAVGLPADAGIDLVGRRPDLVAARLRASAAADQIKVARADFYPNVSITGLIGLQALGIGNVLKSGSSYGTAGPAISLPIFQGGQLSGRYREARANYDEAVAQYDQTLVGALHEVADAAASQRALGLRIADAQSALQNAEAAYSVARQRYEGGLSTYIDVLTAQEGLLGQRRTLADLQARAFTLDVALVRALGGGFTSPPPAQTG